MWNENFVCENVPISYVKWTFHMWKRSQSTCEMKISYEKMFQFHMFFTCEMIFEIFGGTATVPCCWFTVVNTHVILQLFFFSFWFFFSFLLFFIYVYHKKTALMFAQLIKRLQKIFPLLFLQTPPQVHLPREVLSLRPKDFQQDNHLQCLPPPQHRRRYSSLTCR